MLSHAVLPLLCRRIVKIPADAVSGTKHVLGIIPLNVDMHDAKDNTDSLLLRFSDQEQVNRTARAVARRGFLLLDASQADETACALYTTHQ